MHQQLLTAHQSKETERSRLIESLFEGLYQCWNYLTFARQRTNLSASEVTTIWRYTNVYIIIIIIIILFASFCIGPSL